ncbi:MAG: hypothetical protein JETT_2096 [Candidatus Jettenia ecosi]|uniref:Uncharacterized protein n=1 Tax=Candidatus Jettenia ecosi TaxID=2494326 RepID=A0A533QM72_9BACT|nr:MAG: hypothetical protein JETT_2096 [Candidatus Jettenia ecosi]
MAIKKNMKRKNSRPRTISSQLELDNKIAKVIYNKWPRFVTQKEIANELDISQSLVSKRLSRWGKKKTAPLKMFYDERSAGLEEKLKSAYNLDDIVIFKNPDYFVSTRNYFDQIGKYASDVLVRKINDILEKKTEMVNSKTKGTEEINKIEVKISASGGNSVFATVMSLADELENTDIKVLFSGCVALRSSSLIELTPLHIVSQLLNRKLNIDIAHAYQLPETSNLYSRESLYEIVNQRIRTQKMLGFSDRILQSDIVIFGLGSIKWNFPVTGFMHHVYNLRLQSFIKNFDIMGEIAFAPFNKNGFLFHHLVTQVFEQEDGKFLYNEYEQIERLKKFAPNSIAVSRQDLIDAANFFSSIFTINFCEIENSMQKQSKKPYILLVVGGESQKAVPLKTILEKWKYLNIVDGLITSENIAQGL